MGKKVLVAKSGRAACSCAAAGGGIGAKNAKSFLKGLTGFTGLREASVKPAKTKPSGVAWIGDIPDGWAVRRLKYVASCNDDSLAEDTPSNFSFDYVDVGSVKYGLGIVQREPMVFADAPSRARRVVRKDDVIVSTVRTYLKSVAQIPSFNKPIIVSTGFAVLRAKNSDVIFLNYALQSQSFVDEVEARSTGISYPAINASDLVRIKILLPPLSVQRAIAAYLDEKCGAIDAAVAEARKGIEEYKAWKKSLIFEVVTGKRRVGFFNAETRCARDEVVGLPERSEPEGPQGAARRRGAESFSTGLTRFTGLGENLDNPVNPVKTKPSGIPWIGDVPEGWKVRRLKSIFEYRKGLSITKADLTQTGIPVISYGQIHSKENTGTHLQDSLLRFVPLTYLESDGNCLLKEDDFVFADTSEDLEGLGNCVYVDRQDKIFAGYHTIIFRPYGHYRGEVKFRYLAYLFKTDVWRSQFRAKAFGIKVYSLSQRLLNDCCLILPPLPVQRAIAAYLDEKCAAIDKMVAEKEALIADLEAYKKSLIYEVVTGKREVASNSMVK